MGIISSVPKYFFRRSYWKQSVFSLFTLSSKLEYISGGLNYIVNIGKNVFKAGKMVFVPHVIAKTEC